MIQKIFSGFPFKIGSIFKKPAASAAGGAKTSAKASGEFILSLHPEDAELKLALARTKLPGGREISKLLSIPLQNGYTDEVIAQIRSVLTETQAKSFRVVGVVPAHWVLSRNIEVPSRDLTEIREIVNLQAVRHTPYARNEIVVDFLSLGVFKSVYTKVFLIIVPRHAVVRFYDLAAKLNLKVERIVFAPEAVARHLAKRLEAAKEELPFCVVRVDTAVSEFLVILHETLLFARSIPIGSQHFAAAKEGYLIRFVEELKKSLETYQGENIDQNPSVLFLAGALNHLEDLDQMVEDELRFPVKRLNDAELVPVEAGIQSDYAAENRSFFHLMSSAVCLEELTADLIPEENKLKRSVEERSKEMVKTGMLLMILLAIVCAFLVSHLYFQSSRAEQLKNRYEPIRKEAQVIEEAYSHIQAVKQHLASRGQSIETLTELYDVVPSDLYLTDIRFEAGGKFTVKGTSYTKPSIFSLVDKLEDSDLFRNVQTKYITGRTEDKREVSDFEIQAALE